MMKGQSNAAVGIALLFSLGALAWLMFTQTVPAGHRGVLLHWGAVDTSYTLREGLHFQVPLARSIRVIEVRTQRLDVESEAASKDMQDVYADVAVNYHLDGENVNLLYQRLGDDYEVTVIIPVIQQIIKETTVKFTAESLLHNRTVVAKEIGERLSEQLAEYEIFVEKVSIVNLAFDEEFNRAIEQKARAVEDLKRKQIELESAKVDAQKRIEEARGKAEAAELMNQQLRVGPDYIEYLKAEKWDGRLPTVMSPVSPFMDVGGLVG